MLEVYEWSWHPHDSEHASNVHAMFGLMVLLWIRSTAGSPTVKGDFVEWWLLVVWTSPRQLHKETSSLIMLTS
jgi:hypothetical protein